MVSSEPLLLWVVCSDYLYGGFQRLVLTGEGLDRIPEKPAGLHIKLFFRRPGQTELALPVRTDKGIQWPSGEQRPISRTFSIRFYDRENNLLTVDFLLHPNPGVASDWALSAEPGDTIGLAGPGLQPLYNAEAETHYLIGDLSALPALLAVAEEIPAQSGIHGYIELPDGVTPDPQWFQGDHIRVTYTRQNFQPESSLLPLLRKQDMDPRRSAVTLTGEHGTVVMLKQYFRDRKFGKSRLYAVPYWRLGDNEEAYHAERHAVMDN